MTSCSEKGTAQTASAIFFCASAQSAFCFFRSVSLRAASISASATLQWEKLVMPVDVFTVLREWKKLVR